MVETGTILLLRSLEKSCVIAGVSSTFVGQITFRNGSVKHLQKRIKIFLQSGEKDLNIIFGSWVIKNKEMAAAFEYSGYNYKFVFGKGTRPQAWCIDLSGDIAMALG